MIKFISKSKLSEGRRQTKIIQGCIKIFSKGKRYKRGRECTGGLKKGFVQYQVSNRGGKVFN